jgi:hypothetical protein
MELDDKSILEAWDKIVELNYEFRVLLDETLCRFHTRDEVLTVLDKMESLLEEILDEIKYIRNVR